MAEDTHWIVMVVAALAVGAGCGLVNGVLIAYGNIVPFIATLAMLASARGLAEIIERPQDPDRRRTDELQGLLRRRGPRHPGAGAHLRRRGRGVGWVLLNRTTFGRRTLAVGGNPEAARLAGINVKRHTVLLYVLVGVCCGIAAIMLIARTTTGSSTHGNLYELDAIAAVVIGGTLLSGGRGTIVGTVFGVLIFTTLTQRLHPQQPVHLEPRRVARALIIVVAVLLQQRLASRSNTT